MLLFIYKEKKKKCKKTYICSFVQNKCKKRKSVIKEHSYFLVVGIIRRKGDMGKGGEDGGSNVSLNVPFQTALSDPG